MGTDKKTFLKLFTSTFFISAFTFGGGFVIVPLLKRKFVEDLKWIDEKEMMDFIAIAQSSPGAVAINTSILIGYKTAGAKGRRWLFQAQCCLLYGYFGDIVILPWFSG